MDEPKKYLTRESYAPTDAYIRLLRAIDKMYLCNDPGLSKAQDYYEEFLYSMSPQEIWEFYLPKDACPVDDLPADTWHMEGGTRVLLFYRKGGSLKGEEIGEFVDTLLEKELGIKRN